MQIKPAVVVLALAAAPVLTQPLANAEEATVNAREFEERDIAPIDQSELEARKFSFGKLIKGAAKIGGHFLGFRELDEDELMARDFDDEEFEARDFIDEDELEARDFDDLEELEARGMQRPHGGRRHHGHRMGFKHASKGAAGGQGQEMEARDFDDSMEIEARGFRKAGKSSGRGRKIAHGLGGFATHALNGASNAFSMNQAREFDDLEELEARSMQRPHGGRRHHGHRMGFKHASKGAAGGQAQEMEARDFDDLEELEARGIQRQRGGHRHNHRTGRKHGMNRVAAGAGQAQEVEARDFNQIEDLEARGKKAAKGGKKAGKAPNKGGKKGGSRGHGLLNSAAEFAGNVAGSFAGQAINSHFNQRDISESLNELD